MTPTGRQVGEVIERLLDAVPPAGGAAVMGTGIVSIGLGLDGHETFSRVLLAIAVALWLGLAVVLANRAVRHRGRWVEDARSPAALTAVAGTAVLGARLAVQGHSTSAAALLAIALCLWLALVPPVVRHWRTPTVGVSFVLVVSTESLALLAALLALDWRQGWLAATALGPLVLGVLAYVWVLARFGLRQLLDARGDHWVAGGALAIATLACGRITEAAHELPTLAGARRPLADASLALWSAALLWLPALVAAELLAPRLGYDTRRWSTVFPLGMYAVCSFQVGAVDDVAPITAFARAWIWVAVVVWAAVTAGMTRRGAVVARGRAPSVS